MGNDRTAPHQRDRGRAGKGMAGVVGRQDDGNATRRKGADPGDDPGLIAEIEARRRFVHDDECRILGKSAGNQRHLPLAATDLGETAVGEMADADDGERCLGGGMVGAGWRGEGPDAAGTAHEHHLAHGEGKGRGAGLGHVGNAAGKGGAGDAGDRAAVDLDSCQPWAAADRGGCGRAWSCRSRSGRAGRRPRPG